MIQTLLQLLLSEDEIVASVTICGNEMDDFFVSKKFQNQGYGKKLLQFTVSLMQKKEYIPNNTLCC